MKERQVESVILHQYIIELQPQVVQWDTAVRAISNICTAFNEIRDKKQCSTENVVKHVLPLFSLLTYPHAHCLPEKRQMLKAKLTKHVPPLLALRYRHPPPSPPPKDTQRKAEASGKM